jgi:tripartite-type tricarboxylate transporter receptor subunit TctC
MACVHSLLLKAFGLLLALITAAAAQDYPNRPVRVIVPFPPGGVNDTVGRLISTHLSERLGKQFVVENKAGAASIVGSEIAANAPKDGYTLLVVSLVNAVNPWLYKLPYDPANAFTPVAFLATAPNVMVVNPQLPAQSVQELIELAKAKPGDVPYATAGVGSFMHLSAALFVQMTGVDMMHVPFKGGGPAMTDLVAGNTKMGFATTITTTPLVKSGRLKALGVGSLKRSASLPDVPTLSESGVPGYECANWIGLVAPAGTPADIVEKVNREILAIVDLPDVQKRFADQGAEAVRMSPSEFGAFMAKETAKWERVVKEGKIKRE